MKIVVAPDSFKESMSAIEASEAIFEALDAYGIESVLTPLADGGEGTLETLVSAMNGKIETYWVKGVRLEKRAVAVGYVDDIAIIECAKVCGLELLTEAQKNPYHTSTYGLGELILKALDHHVKKLMICLGGSATNDGGIGMMSALGVQFLDEHNKNVIPTMAGLAHIQTIDVSLLDERLKNVEIIGVCDVTNPLCGDNGATYIYGGQKGVKQAEMATIDQAMKDYAKKVDEIYNYDYQNQPGAGAAGGLGYALCAFCQAKLLPGFEVVSEIVELEKHIAKCDKVIVGEGKIDKQTQYGKTPYGVLKIAQKYHKDVFAFAGKVEDLDVLKALGFKNVYAISPEDMPLSMALKKGKENLCQCVKAHMEDIKNEV